MMMNGGVDVVLMMVLAVILAWTSAAGASGKCIGSERQALFSLKRGFNVHDNWLSSWGDGEQQKECCNWEGVTCSNNTCHVVMLDLHHDTFYIADTISPSLGELSHLIYLDLSGIDFMLTPPIPPSIGSLTLLKHLDLSHTSFGGEIPPQLGNLLFLEYLDIKHTNIYGTLPPHLGNLLYLEHLDLSGHAFTGTIPGQFKNLSRLQYLDLNPGPSGRDNILNSDNGESMSLSSDLEWLSQLSTLRYLSLPELNLSSATNWQRQVSGLSHLQYLDLNGCNLVDSMPNSSLAYHANFSTSLSFVDMSDNSLTDSSFIFSWLMNSTSTLVTLRMNDNGLTGTITETFGDKLMSSLEELNLANNELEGQIPVSFFHIGSLTTLDLSHNRFTGMLPEDLSQLSSLQVLRLENNRLNGSIHEGIGQLSNLTELNLGNNLFHGLLSEAHFLRLSNLTTLDLSHNAFVFNVSVKWSPPFDLRVANLASCNLGPNFPRWLHTQMNIENLDISQAQISGLVPNWFWDRSLKMLYMNLSHNHIRGKIEAQIPTNYYTYFPYDDLQTIDYSFNLFEGSIPAFLSKHAEIFLSNNRFSTANLLLCSDTCKNTRFMDLSNNSLSGELPDCWIDFGKLVVLDLSDNHFHGNMPKSLGSLTNIQSIHLGGNNFSGEISSSLINCIELQVFDASDNQLSGTIPSWIGDNIRKLLVLGLHSNKFHGNIPLSMCNLDELRVLDLSQNVLSGRIPTTTTTTTTTKPYPTRWGRLHGSNDAIVLYH
ncbi:hypothetical protein PIB30_083027, partial [Stylosanthes scabra]|nr:hypothetical protein [Stylosanthes scabra]